MAVIDGNIPFPVKGINRRVSYQQGDQQSTPYAVNVFLDDSGERRSRGGSRVGLTKRFSLMLDGLPQVMLVVPVKELNANEGYQVLVIATATNIYVSRAFKFIGSPITYQEQFASITGAIEIEQGGTLDAEDGSPLLVNDFSLGTVSRGGAAVYRGNVIFSPPESILAEGTGTLSAGTLTSGSVADWSAIGIDPTTYLVEITNNGNGGSYRIASVSSGSIVLSDTGLAGSCGFRVLAGLRVLDPFAPDLTLLVPTKGYAPPSPDIIATYLDRLVFAKGRVWYMSRQGDYTDYDYGADAADAGRAVAGTISDAGQPGESIIAIAPGGYDYLMMFAEDSTWVMRGDPAYGGKLYNLSRTCGCVDPDGWCHGQSGEVYFLAKTGLFVISANVSEPPQPLSDQALPYELRGIDRFNYSVTLVYDSQNVGIYVFRTPKDGTTGEHWWFSLRSGSFWRMGFTNDGHQPVQAVSYSGSPTAQPNVVTACVDGYVRQLGGTTDDGQLIQSSVVLGPYTLSGSVTMDSILSQIVGIIDIDSGVVALEIYTASNAEEATRNAIAGLVPNYRSVLTPGRSLNYRPRCRGNSFCCKVIGNGLWAFESLATVVAAVGQHRS